MQKAMVFLQIAESSDETTISHQFLVTYNTICSLKQGNGKKTICRMTRRPTCLVSSLYLHFNFVQKHDFKHHIMTYDVQVQPWREPMFLRFISI